MISTYSLDNFTPIPTTVTVETQRRLPAVAWVGVAPSPAREIGERVRSALEAHSLWADYRPRGRLVATATPEVRYTSTWLDLPMAMALLVTGGAPLTIPEWVAFVGELSLSGFIRPTRGALAMARDAASKGGVVVLSRGSAQQVVDADPRLVPHVRGAETINDVFLAFRTTDPVALPSLTPNPIPAPPPAHDFADLDQTAEPGIRAVVVGAALGLPITLWGPPGCGRSLCCPYCRAIKSIRTAIARRLPDVLAAHDSEEDRIERMARVEASGLPIGNGPGFRAPHYTVSEAGMVGSAGRPGEFDLAYRGVLLLDEAEEFSRGVYRMAHQQQATQGYALIIATDRCDHRNARHGRPGIGVELGLQPRVRETPARPTAYWSEVYGAIRARGLSGLAGVAEALAIAEPTWSADDCAAEAARWITGGAVEAPAT